MDEKEGTTTYDTSGSEITGTLTNGPNWVRGKYGSAINFHGDNDRVGLGTPDELDLHKNDLTMSAWVKMTAYSTYGHIISNAGGGSQKDYRIQLGSDSADELELNVFTSGGSSAAYCDLDPLVAGEWHYLTYTFSDGYGRCYFDGSLNDTSSQYLGPRGDASAVETTIGSRGSGSYFNGVIDEVKIYNYARTSDQIIEDMNAGHPAGGSPVGSPISYWKFDEGVSDTANDSVGNNHGTLDASTGGSNTTETEMWSLDAKKKGKAIEFDGTDDHVEIADPGTDSLFDFDAGDSITISQWIKPAALTAWSALLLKGDITSGDSSNYGLEMDGTLPAKLTFYHHDDQKNRSVNDVFTVGAWSHIAVTHTFGDGDTFQMYHNGEAIESTWISGDGDASPTISNQPIWMGNNFWD